MVEREEINHTQPKGGSIPKKGYIQYIYMYMTQSHTTQSASPSLDGAQTPPVPSVCYVYKCVNPFALGASCVVVGNLVNVTKQMYCLIAKGFLFEINNERELAKVPVGDADTISGFSFASKNGARHRTLPP